MTQARIAPLSALLDGRSVLWRLGAILAGSWLLAASAWTEVPMYPVPMTLQTFGVLAIAAVSGPRLTLEIIGAYLAQAAAGLPVLAGGAGGVAPFFGPTAGYLAGFLIGGVAVAWMAQRARGWFSLTVIFMAGHAIILASGFTWLAVLLGPAAAWAGGVVPFLVGSVVKSMMALATTRIADQTVPRRGR